MSKVNYQVMQNVLAAIRQNFTVAPKPFQPSPTFGLPKINTAKTLLNYTVSSLSFL
jgi:hypothetical protein